MIRQGEVYYADLGGAGRRPVVVVSREPLNRGGYVVVVAFTTARLDRRRELANCAFFRAGEFGLSADCVAQAETIAGIPSGRLDPTPVGVLDTSALRHVIASIGNVINADCEML